MLTRTELQRLAQVRFEDAVFLLRANRPSSAYYLAGYAVELALKACISRQVQSDTIPDKAFINAIYTHSPEKLLSVSGLRPQFDAAVQADSQFGAYWAIVNNWTEESRYEVWDATTAATLLTAIGDPQHGVFRWLAQHW